VTLINQAVEEALQLTSRYAMDMEFDDDAPPDLVETGVEPGDDEKTVKVPITIVTGVVHCKETTSPSGSN
jgi:hypothetical protein